MNIFFRYLSFILIIAAVAAATSCSSNSLDDDSGNSNFDRAAMLQNYGNNTIIPAYDTLEEAINTMQKAAESFSEDPSEATLSTLQSELKTARLAWQDASMFQFGPAESAVLRTVVNTYPADTDRIEDNIDSGDYTFGTIDNRAAAGFPALGYLLHGTGNTAGEIVSQYTNEEDTDARMAYLLDNINFMTQKTEAVASEWRADGGNYIAAFLSDESDGTDVGSSLGMLVNAMVLHYERFLRDGKVGIPSGVRSAGVPRPSATEAFYGGYSLELSIANLQAMQRLYAGDGLNGMNGSGLEANLEARDAQALADEISTRLDKAVSAQQELNDPLSAQIEENNEPVTQAFTQLQDVISLLKADMTSILGVTITFQDNDGD
jgi:predicted lipoprotein